MGHPTRISWRGVSIVRVGGARAPACKTWEHKKTAEPPAVEVSAGPRRRCFVRAGLRSSLERASTATRFHGVRVIERESTLLDPFVEINRGAIQVEGALLIDDNIDAVLA